MIPLISFKQFLTDMRRQKLRTAVTVFGVFWGSCSIVLLFAFGKGITEAQLRSQRGLGENIAIFWSGITADEFEGLPSGRRIRPTEDDVKLIKRKARLVRRIRQPAAIRGPKRTGETLPTSCKRDQVSTVLIPHPDLAITQQGDVLARGSRCRRRRRGCS